MKRNPVVFRVRKKIWFLEKLNDISVGSYGLLTGEHWIKIISDEYNASNVIALAMLSVILVAAWTVIGLAKSNLEAMYDRR